MTSAAPTTAEPPAWRDRALIDADRTVWRTGLLRALVAYLTSRLCVALGAGIVSAQRAVDESIETGDRPRSAIGAMIDVLMSWDGQWYLEIIRRGYPDAVPAGITYEQVEARAAFFPGYPYLARVIDQVLPGGDTLAALSTNLVLGALAILTVGLLAREVAGAAVAGRSMILMAFFPGSFVLSFAYSEPLLLVVAALCLLALVREQWVIAGLLAGLGTATRPNGIALVAACAVAALVAIRHRRQWSSLVAPALAPIGFVAFQLLLDAHADERGVWFRVQREAWDEGTSFGLTALSSTWEFLQSPLASPTDLVTTASLIGLVVLVVAAWRRPLPAPLVAYSAAVIVLMVLPETVTARPRFLYTAFPLLIALAWLFEPRPTPPEHRPGDAAPSPTSSVWVRSADDVWTLLLVVFSAGIVTLTALYGVFAVIP